MLFGVILFLTVAAFFGGRGCLKGLLSIFFGVMLLMVGWAIV